MQALVTGASGFLGHILIGQLLGAGASVVAAVGPAQNELESRRIQELRRLDVRTVACDLRRERPLSEVPSWDTLFHLAAYVRTEHESADVHVNDVGTARLLAQLPLAHKRVIYTSTIAVADNAPHGEVTQATVCSPRTAYGRTKLAAEAIIREQCASNSANYTIVRLPTLYGPGYRTGGMFDVLPKKLAAGALLARLAWPGKLALLAVEDAAKLVLSSANTSKTIGRTLLASSNENPATYEIVQAIAAATGAPYRRLDFPGPASAILRSALGGRWQAPMLPHVLRVAAWRADLLLNGLYCDGSELNEMLGLACCDWRAGFVRMYAEDPRHCRSAEATAAENFAADP